MDEDDFSYDELMKDADPKSDDETERPLDVNDEAEHLSKMSLMKYCVTAIWTLLY